MQSGGGRGLGRTVEVLIAVGQVDQYLQACKAHDRATARLVERLAQADRPRMRLNLTAPRVEVRPRPAPVRVDVQALFAQLTAGAKRAA